jgi:para-aminobenzoate synthetase component 1
MIKNKIQREEYIAIINKLRDHILRGDCYEINFCQEFFASPVFIDPVSVYNKLSHISPNPFSALYRLDDKWLICASPERFLKSKVRRYYLNQLRVLPKEYCTVMQTTIKVKWICIRVQGPF